MIHRIIDGCGLLNNKKNGIKVRKEDVTKIISIGLEILIYL